MTVLESWFSERERFLSVAGTMRTRQAGCQGQDGCQNTDH